MRHKCMRLLFGVLLGVTLLAGCGPSGSPEAEPTPTTTTTDEPYIVPTVTPPDFSDPYAEP